MTTTTAPAPVVWPAGVIARYPTRAAEITGDLSLSVEIAEERNAERPEYYGYRARCRGCHDSTFYDRDRTARIRGRELVTAFDAELLAREWAQSHAETCRAVPRPIG